MSRPKAFLRPLASIGFAVFVLAVGGAGCSVFALGGGRGEGEGEPAEGEGEPAEGEGEGDPPGGCSCAGTDGTAVLAMGLISLPILVVKRRRARYIQGLDRV